MEPVCGYHQTTILRVFIVLCMVGAIFPTGGQTSSITHGPTSIPPPPTTPDFECNNGDTKESGCYGYNCIDRKWEHFFIVNEHCCEQEPYQYGCKLLTTSTLSTSTLTTYITTTTTTTDSTTTIIDSIKTDSIKTDSTTTDSTTTDSTTTTKTIIDSSTNNITTTDNTTTSTGGFSKTNDTVSGGRDYKDASIALSVVTGVLFTQLVMASQRT